MASGPLAVLLEGALQRRGGLLESLHAEGTDSYRLFHGIAEGLPGLTIDRYGPLVLLQTFRERLEPADLDAVEETLKKGLPFAFSLACSHRGPGYDRPYDEWQRSRLEGAEEVECREFGLRFLARRRHRGIDPWLFLDLRAGRRFLRGAASGRSVLNLFAYTCGAGVCAAAAGASEVWNVDFASSSLEVGRRNAALNGVGAERFRTIQEDCLPVARQLAGLPPGGRRGKVGRFQRFEPRGFDLVFLDPPAWAKGAFGAVDVEGDYPSLFKPAVLAARPAGGVVVATNHVASVGFDAWADVLRRCAEKAGRPLRSLRAVAPEGDFPSFDGRPPLKIAVCEV
ncbi:MAG: class I SAM-dependent methyltransferase [Elusimicrobia bacterium]|nr:class I SAM-dependent methyltransferase [Elusimicrobiota bacterium]